MTIHNDKGQLDATKVQSSEHSADQLDSCDQTIYDKVTALLNSCEARYRVVEHEPIGTSVEVAKARGTSLEQGAKAMIVKVSVTKKSRLYYLAVFPSNLQLDREKVAMIANVTSKKVGLAHKLKAAELAGCEMNTVPPFSFHPELKLLVDKKMTDVEEIAFNAASLDRSIILNTEDYLKAVNVAKADLVDISSES